MEFILIISILYIIEAFVLCVCIKKVNSAMKRKRKWLVILSMIVAPFLLYGVITLVLFVIRGDCFAGYYTPHRQEIYYEGRYYCLVEDKETIDEIFEYVDGEWEDTGKMITAGPLKFPYDEYWFPDFFYNKLYLSSDKEPIYLWLSTIDSNYYYVRD